VAVLPPGEATEIDYASTTQALLVRTYLDRVRRRPATISPSVQAAKLVRVTDAPLDHDRSRSTSGASEHRTALRLAVPVSLDLTTCPLLSRSLEAPAASRPPAAVRRAAAFIDARADEPIGLTEIARAAGLSPRALQAGFRRHLDTTPLGYLRSVRISRAHADLLAARPGDGQTVSSVASRWGLTQLSRFAQDYWRRYGEYPRETLGRYRS
jgi:transcriptional regulator GlxA family with amidase domain